MVGRTVSFYPVAKRWPRSRTGHLARAAGGCAGPWLREDEAASNLAHCGDNLTCFSFRSLPRLQNLPTESNDRSPVVYLDGSAFVAR